MDIQKKFKDNKFIEFNLCIFLFLWFLKNILISGCAVYPASFTCINKLPWYNTENRNFIDANQISLESEAWAKNWNTYNKKQISLGKKNIDKIESQKKYVKRFFWFKEWSNVHGLVILKKDRNLFNSYLDFNNLRKKKSL